MMHMETVLDSTIIESMKTKIDNVTDFLLLSIAWFYDFLGFASMFIYYDSSLGGLCCIALHDFDALHCMKKMNGLNTYMHAYFLDLLVFFHTPF